MTLRPQSTRFSRVARAGQRMAPGGNRWSESPIPRVGIRRVRGVGVAQAPAAPTWLDWWYVNTTSSRGTADVDVSDWFSTDWPSGHDNDWLEDGDTAVIVASMWGQALSAPTGWTSLLSGNVGDLHYLVAAQSNVTIDDPVVVGTPAGTVTVGTMFILGFTEVPAGYEVKATTVDSNASASTHDVTLPTSGWLTSWSVVLLGHGTVLHDHTTDLNASYLEYGHEQYPSAAPDVTQLMTHPGHALTSATVDTVQRADGTTPLATTGAMFALGFEPV